MYWERTHNAKESSRLGLYSLEEDIGSGLGTAPRGLSALSEVCLDVRRDKGIVAD